MLKKTENKLKEPGDCPLKKDILHLAAINSANRYGAIEKRKRKQKEAWDQCDQIWRFIGLWATFKSFWQQLICPNLSHS